MASIQFERAVIEKVEATVNEDRGGLQFDFKVNCLLDPILASRLGIDEMLFTWRPAKFEKYEDLPKDARVIEPGPHRDGFKRVDLTRKLGAGALTLGKAQSYQLRIEKADKMAAKVGEDVVWLTFSMQHVGDGEELINYYRANGNGSSTMTLELDQKELAF